jgi:hypothetical protein
MGTEVIDESRNCPMCGHATWTLLEGYSTLQALEGGSKPLRTHVTSADSSAGIAWT